MKLSIYIPTLKRDELFERCRLSIERSVAAAEDVAVDHEVVVVEGVSPVSAARNEALRRVTGDWIATVDADDEVEETWFGEISKAIREADRPDSDIDGIVFDMMVESGGRNRVLRYGREGIVDAATLREDVLYEMRIFGHLVRHVIRRELWNGVRFDAVQVLEDALVLPQVLSRARRIRYIDRPLYRYIRRAESLCSTTPLVEFLRISIGQVARFGKPAAVGACIAAYNCLYDRVDVDGEARRWIRRNLPTVLADRKVGWRWKLKFVLAALGVIVRRPK